MTSLPISLPRGCNAAVKVGDLVTMGQILATVTIQREEQFIDIARVFGTTRRKARKLVHKNPGDRIKPGDVIAVRKKLFGKKISLISDGQGIVKGYERESGQLVVLRSDAIVSGRDTDYTSASEPTIITAPIGGVVIEVDDTKIVIETDKPTLMARHGAGGAVQAELLVLDSAQGKDSETKAVLPYELGAGVVGKILLGGMFSREDLVKCSSLGVAGIMGAAITKEDIAYLVEKRLLLPLVEVDETIWHTLAKHGEKQVFLNADNGTILPL